MSRRILFWTSILFLVSWATSGAIHLAGYGVAMAHPYLQGMLDGASLLFAVDLLAGRLSRHGGSKEIGA